MMLMHLVSSTDRQVVKQGCFVLHQPSPQTPTDVTSDCSWGLLCSSGKAAAGMCADL